MKLTKEEELHKYNLTPYERIETEYSERGEPFRIETLRTKKHLKRFTKEEIASIEAIPIIFYLAFSFVVLLISCCLFVVFYF